MMGNGVRRSAVTGWLSKKQTLISLWLLGSCGAAEAQSNLTSSQAVNIISAIAAFYFTVFIVISVLLVCFCYWKKKGRVCPISQIESDHMKSPSSKSYTQVTVTSAKPKPKKMVVKKATAGEKMERWPSNIDAVAYGNPAFHDGHSSSKISSDTETRRSRSEMEKHSSLVIINESSIDELPDDETEDDIITEI